jgi:peptide/nickel transport system ATP-binding protein
MSVFSLRDWRVEIKGPQGTFLPVVRGVDLEVAAGEIVGLVGESGCGKSMTLLSAIGLLPEETRARVSGAGRLGAHDLLSLNERSWRALRGREVSVVFQEPMTGLNPLERVETQLAHVLRLHGRGTRADVPEMLRRVRISDPERVARAWPAELSGGMRQRVMIAMALACEPRLLVADEPTTALDVSVQADILDLMRARRQETGMAIVWATHDLRVVRAFCDRVCVMYAGKIVEEGAVADVFAAPSHPYTAGLLASLPPLEGARRALAGIPGEVCGIGPLPRGCAFAPRCSRQAARCREEEPLLASVNERARARCFFAGERL